MTLIVGYIHSDSSVHIIADSAETITGFIENPNIGSGAYNSFGEIIQLEDNEIVLESAQKIYNVGETVLITFSGQVFEGRQVLGDLKFEIEIQKDLKISEIISNYFTIRKPTLTEYIIVFFEDNKSKLYYFKEKGNFLNDIGSYVILGSGSQNELIIAPLNYILEPLYKMQTDPKNLLIFIISMVQCCAINALSFKKGVGGFFNGATIFNNKIYWADDTCNVLYSSKHFEKAERFIVKKFNRDNITFLTSPQIKNAAFSPGLEWVTFTTNEWVEKWIDHLLELNANCELDYYVFICYDRRIITIVNRHNKRFSTNLKMERLNDGEVNLILSQNLIDNLLRFAIDTKTGTESADGFGVQFNYI
nr:hypothetical protein [uncultured Flavobacterium sp.]